MSKARDIRKGDPIRVGGRTVTVTRSELDRDGKWSISWASGTASGMHRCMPCADVKVIYKPSGWLWPEDIRLRVAEIAAMTGDPERAHSMEDGLREDVLMAIAEGAPHPLLLANLALKTRNLDFPRWAS